MVPPFPIPNREVKRASAHDTLGVYLGDNRSLPGDFFLQISSFTPCHSELVSESPKLFLFFNLYFFFSCVDKRSRSSPPVSLHAFRILLICRGISPLPRFCFAERGIPLTIHKIHHDISLRTAEIKNILLGVGGFVSSKQLIYNIIKLA
jgi:hypothetical protein